MPCPQAGNGSLSGGEEDLGDGGGKPVRTVTTIHEFLIKATGAAMARLLPDDVLDWGMDGTIIVMDAAFVAAGATCGTTVMPPANTHALQASVTQIHQCCTPLIVGWVVMHTPCGLPAGCSRSTTLHCMACIPTRKQLGSTP